MVSALHHPVLFCYDHLSLRALDNAFKEAALNLIVTLFAPKSMLARLAEPGSAASIARLALLILPMPALFAFIGTSTFGWRLGAEAPLTFSSGATLVISLAYFAAVCFGFFSTVLISLWMAGTYGARTDLRVHLALFVVVSAPLAVGSLAHLFPHVFFNVMVLIPAIIWSMSLLYSGLPLALGIPPERGMLMASSLVGWLLVAAVSLLGITAMLWTQGIGASVRV
jgi:hypothetical protein